MDDGIFQAVYKPCGLPGLDALKYVEGENWLGVALAALMKIPKEQVAWLGAEALRRIQTAPLSDQQRFLLGECVQAYLPLNDEQQRQFERLLASEAYSGVQAMNTTSYEKGLQKGLEKAQAMNTTWYEKGLEKGLEKGQRELLRDLLETKFAPLSASVLERLDRLPAERVRALGKAILKANSLQELGLED